MMVISFCSWRANSDRVSKRKHIPLQGEQGWFFVQEIEQDPRIPAADADGLEFRQQLPADSHRRIRPCVL